MITVISTNISKSASKGKSKQPVASITLDVNGVIGDAHAGPGNRQVSMLTAESLSDFQARTGHKVASGEFAENLTISGLDLKIVAPLDRLQIGEVVLEITQLGKKCYGAVCEIFRKVGPCTMLTDGAFARVVRGGKINPGDEVIYQPRPLKILIVTLSDRAVAGVYEDRSGPTAKTLLTEFFQGKRWHWQIETVLLPDDIEQLRAVLSDAIAREFDIIFTLGSTGAGPRDIAPEVVAALGGKIIPGIMEHVRIKYGAVNLAALLSRSIAAVKNTTQIYTLPGSVKAVTEYCAEVIPLLGHVFHMVHGIDLH